eukprot:749516-Hanusia_phi.AAC.2
MSSSPCSFLCKPHPLSLFSPPRPHCLFFLYTFSSLSPPSTPSSILLPFSLPPLPAPPADVNGVAYSPPRAAAILQVAAGARCPFLLLPPPRSVTEENDSGLSEKDVAALQVLRLPSRSLPVMMLAGAGNEHQPAC